jgi:hypothetical protein
LTLNMDVRIQLQQEREQFLRRQSLSGFYRVGVGIEVGRRMEVG